MNRSAAWLGSRALGAGVFPTLLSALLLVAGAHTAAAAGGVGGACAGDCDGSGDVTVNETITLVNIALGTQHVSDCPNGLPVTDADVTIAVIIQSVSNALDGCPSLPTPTPTPVFRPLTATMTSIRVGHAATSLPNGKVLLIGGCGNSCRTSDTALNTAEVYDPGANKFTAVSATMTSGRFGLTATLLKNGLVLITGGTNSTGDGPTLNTAELYDPAANEFAPPPAAMTAAGGRFAHTATLLQDGQVLITGGFTDTNPDGTPLNTAELYDPVAKIFTAVPGTMTSVRAEHAATLLPNGQVLLTGGTTEFADLDTAELYDPVAKNFTAVPRTMTSVRVGHTATLLLNDQVLLTGGSNVPHAVTVLDTAELYDPVAQQFAPLPTTMTSGRWAHTATLLPSGQVLLTGGFNGSAGFNTAELYVP